MGSPVRRIFGTEILRMSPQAVDTSRIRSSLCPLLDSHNNSTIANVLGRVSKSWFVGGALHGRLIFAETPEGIRAMGMVGRGEVSSVSLGYRVDQWEITDADDRVIDPEREHVRWDDDLTFTATKWQVLECSLVSTPADSSALIRSRAGSDHIFDCRERMTIRERMQIRQAMHDRQQAMNQRLQ
jgi:phage head maturation protease